MPTKTFTKEEMQNILWEEVGEIISDKVTDNSRWAVHHELTFRYGDKVYRTNYRVGATEYQDEAPFEYDTTVDCVEMVQKEITRLEWVPAE